MKAQVIERERQGSLPARLAVGFVLLSGLLYVLGYSLSKALVGTFGLTALQVTFLRCALVLAASCAALPWPQTGVTWKRICRPVRAWEQRAAAAALVASNALAVLAYSMMPVTAASALGFTAPLLLAALGGLVLRERVSVGRWLGTVTGFAGMLLIVKPGTSVAWAGVAASVGAAVTYAAYQVLIRRLRDVATSLDTAMQVAVVGAILLAGTMFMAWRHIGWTALGIVLVFTIVQTAALASIAAALRRSEASQLAPWQFSGLLWVMLLDAVMFGGTPSVGSLLGGALILAGGLLAQSDIRCYRTPEH